MAQDMRRKTTPYAQSPQNSPGSRSSRTQASPNSQHLQGGASSWSPNNSSSKLKNHDDHGSHHKKSVLMKVKEKARKLKKSLSVRKRRDSNEFHSPYSTPPAGPRFEDDKKDEPEYFSSPVHESGVESGPDKPAAKEPSQEANTLSSQKHNRKNNIDWKTNEHQNTNTTTTANSSPENTDSGLTISTSGCTGTGSHDSGTPESNSGKKENIQSPRNNKGVSVKEYLMQKFEPGEDERALSQVITQTISPRRRKVREAMSSFLRTEEPSVLSQDVAASSGSSQDVAASSSTEPPDLNSSLLNGLSGPSHGLKSSLSNASNLSLMSSSTAASWQNQNDSNLNSDEVVTDKNRQRIPQAN